MLSLVHPACRVLLLLAILLEFWPASATAPAQTSRKPNIILIVTDDQDSRSLEQMPTVLELLAQQGTSFANFLVSTPGCCPSRSSILRGQYTHNHGVLFSDGPDGGYETFQVLGREESTLATWLQDAGYRTALVGKYLNGYGEDNGITRVPPGWSRWYATTSLKYFDYDLVENGRRVHYGSRSRDYLTTVLSDKASEFVRESANRGRPFFLYLNPRAPHGPATAPPHQEGLFDGVTTPRSASFNEVDVSDKPAYVRQSSQLSRREIYELDALYRNRLRTLAAVDKMVLKLVRTLQSTGTLENTYIFFTSDNGFLLGEHRRTEKGMPYEEAIRVPLIVRGPGVHVGTTPALASNIDLAPTIAELTDATVPEFVDGRSLVPLLEGETVPTWRQAVLVAAFGRDESFTLRDNEGKLRNPPFRALRLQDWVYIDYPTTHERELYDLRSDPYQLQNLAEDSAYEAEVSRLHKWLEALAACAGSECVQLENEPNAKHSLGGARENSGKDSTKKPNHKPQRQEQGKE
jgi:N-acetylglucosamine-6-sulfatase